MPARMNQPALKQYPEPEFPDEKARRAYRHARESILAAVESTRTGKPIVEMDFGGAGLVALPPEVGQHVALRRLFLQNNDLTGLPPEIGQLTALVELDVSDNQLASLPPEIGQLTALRQLRLWTNKLTALPMEIGQLSALTVLFLYRNQLTELPPEFGQLGALTELYLSYNQLTALPSEIGRLTALKHIYLSHNKLTTLPSEVGQLTALTELDLSDNQLTALPESLRGIMELTHLLLDGNDKLGLPPELVARMTEHDAAEGYAAVSPRTILDYYFAMQQGERPLNEVKLLLIGRGGAGKTATMNRLLGLGFVPGTDETLGIEITDWTLPAPGGDPVRVHGWDFAGQTVTHQLHKFFLSHRSIYILVLSGREETAQDDAEYWLKLMEAYAIETHRRFEAGTRKMILEVKLPSPVLMVLNKWEAGHTQAKVDRRALEEKYPWIAGWVETDCQTGLGYTHGKVLLPERLAEVVGSMEWVREGFPAAWHRAKEYFSKMEKDYMAFTDFESHCVKELGVPADKVRSLAVVLHRLGIALNYGDDPRLCDTTVLNPHWVTRTIYKVLREAPRDMDAVMTLEHVAEVLPQEPPHMRAYVVELMRRFDQAFPLPDKESQWLVPARLPEAQPKGIAEEFGPQVEGATRLRFTVNPLPRMILPNFVTRTHILSDDLAKMRWANGVVLELNKARALVKADHADRTVTITVTGESKDRPTLASMCRRELGSLFAEIPGLSPREELQVGPDDWVNVALMEKMERQRFSHVHMLLGGEVSFLPVLQSLNSITPHQARDPSVSKPSVFISYAHSDERFKDELVMRMKVLQAAGLAGEVWTDRMLEPGENWNSSIIRNLENADMVLLLLSNAAMASDYIQKTEAQKALARHKAGTAVVVPVVLERCQWNLSELKDLQAVPKDAKPLREWRPRNAGWFNVMESLRGKIETMQAKRK